MGINVDNLPVYGLERKPINSDHIEEEIKETLDRDPYVCQLCGDDGRQWRIRTKYTHLPKGKNVLFFLCYLCDSCYEALING